MPEQKGKPMHGLKMRVQENDSPVACMEGDLDFATAPQVRERLMRLLDPGHPNLTVDLSRCDYVDSSGMLALVAAAHRARTAGGMLCLQQPSTTLVKMLQLSHLGEALGIPGHTPPRTRAGRIVDTGVGQWEVTRVVIAATPCSCALIRHAVLEESAQMPLTADDRADLELAVGEALANAVRHGSPGAERDQMTIRSLRSRDAMVVEVSDRGAGFERAQVVLPAPDQIREGGMGIFYMEALMDAVEFESCSRGTTVRLVKMFPQNSLTTNEPE